MTNLFDSLLLLPNICDPAAFMTWLDSMETFVQQYLCSTNEDVFGRHLLDILFGGAWITDKHDVVVYANHAISKLVGLPRDKIVGNEICNGFQIKAFQHFIPFYFKAKNERCPIRYGPIPVCAPEKSSNHQASGWLIPSYNDEQFNGMICSVSTVNESKRLSFSDARWQSLSEYSADCIMTIDLEGVVLSVNHPLPGFTLNVILGSNIRTVLPESTRKEVEECLQKVIKTQAFDHCYSEYITKDGAIICLETRVGPIMREGNTLGFIVCFSDITRLKVLEQEINKLESNLAETNITLKVLLKRIENERLLFQENLSTNILCNIEPHMKKLKQTSLDRDQAKTLEILEQNIKDMASPLIYSVMTMNLRLTPSEMQISNFIRQGYSSKEIAELLNISPATIDKHRKNIRKKLSITNKKQNLRSVLSSIST
jgi:PAS domain S-box-containing protein